MALLACLAAALGCTEDTALVPDKIELVSGNNQAGIPGEILKPLVVQVQAPRSVDFFGRRGERRPMPGVPVTFNVDVPRPGSVKGRDAEAEDGAEKERSPAKAGTATAPGEKEPGAEPSPSTDAAGKAPNGTEEDLAVFTSLPFHPLIHPISGGPPDSGKHKKKVKEDESPMGVLKLEAVTDADGFARVGVRLGTRNGDYSVTANISRKEQVRFRLVTGAVQDLSDMEGLVGSKVPLRMTLMRLKDEKDLGSLEPITDRLVVFQLIGTPVGAEDTAIIKDKRNRTDKTNGLRETELTLGDRPGYYTVLAEVETGKGEEPLPPLLFSFVAMDWVLVSLKIITGILVFLIGVRLFGNGFLLLTSPYMDLPTGPWTQHRFRGYFGGLLSGALFESSSLVSSYLTSFANGGLITAAGGMGIILGANVGGTILPQILSLDIAVLAAPLLAIGILCLAIFRRAGLFSWGWVFLGAGLVLTGWGLLDQACQLTALSRQFRTDVLPGPVDFSSLSFSTLTARFFSYFMVGAISAFVFRTSNLVVVTVMLAAAHGILGIPTALALLLGANLGSAAMVFALSLTKRREAQRLAILNLTVQVLGCAGAIVLSFIPLHGQSVFVWLVEWATPGHMLSTFPSGVQRHIATAHTLYNLCAGMVFLVFPGALLSLVDKVLASKPTEAQVKPYLLDRNLINVPALALRQTTEEVIYLTELCRKAVAEAFDSFRYHDLDLSEQVVRREEVISSVHREVSQYLVEVGENQLARLDASHLEILQTTVSSLDRIGGLAERLRDVTARKIEENVKAAEEVERDLSEVYDLVMAQFSNILSLLREQDTKTEENTVKMVERLAKISSRVEAQWRQRIEQGEAGVNPLSIHLQTVVYQEAFGILFRVGGHLAHVAERMRILRPERF